MYGRTMRVIAIATGTLLVTMSNSGVVEAAANEAPYSSVVQSLAANLVAVVSPPDVMRQNARHSAETSIDQGLARDPNLPAAEIAYPGLSGAMKAAGMAAVEPLIDNACQDLASRQRDLFARSFTVSELRELIAFYSSPTAKQAAAAALAITRDPRDPVGTNDMKAKAGEGELTERDFSRLGNALAQTKVPPSVDQALQKFSTSGVYKKLNFFNPELDKTMAQWLNDYTPKIQSAIRVSMTDKAAAYIAGHR